MVFNGRPLFMVLVDPQRLPYYVFSFGAGRGGGVLSSLGVGCK